MVFFKTKRKDKEICSSFLYILADFQSSQYVARLPNTKVYPVVKWPDFNAKWLFLFEMSRYMSYTSPPYCAIFNLAQIPHVINPFCIGSILLWLYFIFHLCGYCVSKMKYLKGLFHPPVTRKIAYELAICSYMPKSLSYSRLHKRKCGQQVEGDVSSPLCSCEMSPGLLWTCWSWSRRVTHRWSEGLSIATGKKDWESSGRSAWRSFWQLIWPLNM